MRRPQKREAKKPKKPKQPKGPANPASPAPPVLGFESTDPEWRRLSPFARQAMSHFKDLDIFEETIGWVVATALHLKDAEIEDAVLVLTQIERALDELVAAGLLEVCLGRLPAKFYPATPVASLVNIGLADRLHLVIDGEKKWTLHDLQPKEEFAFVMVTHKGKRMLGRVYAGSEFPW